MDNNIQIFIFLKRSAKSLNKIAEKIMEKLQFEGSSITYTNGTNLITLQLKSKKNLKEVVKQINKTKEIDNFYLWSNPKQEIADALSNHDYFKAFALSCTMYEFLAKKTLTNYFKVKKLIIDDDKIRRLGLETVITMLYSHQIIDQPTFSDIINVNKIRINFIHFELSELLPKKDFQNIVQAIPKITRSIDKLKKAYLTSVHSLGLAGLSESRKVRKVE